MDGVTKNRGNREEREMVLREVLRIRFAEEVEKIRGGPVKGTGGESGRKGQESWVSWKAERRNGQEIWNVAGRLMQRFLRKRDGTKEMISQKG